MLHSSILNILCVTDYYLPGMRAGGLISSIAGLREVLRDKAKIFIFTRSRDLGERGPYANVIPNLWIETEAGSVFYADNHTFNLKGLKSAISSQNFDAIYLNSFFLAIWLNISAHRSQIHIRNYFGPPRGSRAERRILTGCDFYEISEKEALHSRCQSDRHL